MTESTFVNNASTSENLQIIPVGEIRLGMFVHAIAEQVGKLSVLHKGKVKHANLVAKLKASGVKTVIVESSPATVKQSFSFRSKTLSKAIARAPLKDSSEYAQAAQLLKNSKRIYASFTESVEKDLRIDFTSTKVLISTVYGNLAKHSNALLCMSTIMNEDNYLANHSIRVATLICNFAQKLNMPQSDCEQLALVGYLYDIGMLKVSSTIRDKIGLLDHNEKVEIQRHVEHSLSLLEPLQLSPQCLLTIEQHHERLDGSGYPNGDSGSKIHKFSRMLAIIDCYDALTSPRKQKKPLSSAAAMKVLSNPDHGYDQKLVLQFIRCIGIYPVGSLVVLSNKCIALVTKTHKDSPTAPEVKVFYSLLGNNFIVPSHIDLAKVDPSQKPDNNLRVIKPVLASQYGLNLKQIVS